MDFAENHSTGHLRPVRTAEILCVKRVCQNTRLRARPLLSSDLRYGPTYVEPNAIQARRFAGKFLNPASLPIESDPANKVILPDVCDPS